MVDGRTPNKDVKKQTRRTHGYQRLVSSRQRDRHRPDRFSDVLTTAASTPRFRPSTTPTSKLATLSYSELAGSTTPYHTDLASTNPPTPTMTDPALLTDDSALNPATGTTDDLAMESLTPGTVDHTILYLAIHLSSNRTILPGTTPLSHLLLYTNTLQNGLRGS
jgi:hypothetical protein